MSTSRAESIQSMQQRVDTYISQFKEGYFSPLAMMARFTEEIGELAREVNHLYGEKPKKKSEDKNTIENELGDLLFVILSFANSLDIDLSDAFDQAMTKIETRDKDRWTKKETEREYNE
ncbi:nucleotide pyrophosphohydrolase [Amphibacillus jilinensis]|uniref:nucleotide pyrophosphohydrolase n=1 Tax=Amphibacillus jilinensis TaxID=1216008 RepID=UPI0002D7C338|nr:nucleotide pyrophosphohydrolase [Amphibacillus jilinensis]